jgi:hypothetical protein
VPINVYYNIESGIRTYFPKLCYQFYIPNELVFVLMHVDCENKIFLKILIKNKYIILHICYMP